MRILLRRSKGEKLPPAAPDVISSKSPPKDLPSIALLRAGGVCPVCNYAKARDRNWGLTPKNLHLVKVAADDGCEKCYLMLDVLPEFFSPGQGPPFWHGTPPWEVEIEPPRTILGGTKKTSAKAAVPQTEEWRISMKQMSPRLASALYLPIQSRQKLAHVRRLLANCVFAHPDCRSKVKDWSPRRVLDVGTLTRDPCLVEPCAGTSYAALSYCWGLTKDTLVTTRSNIDDHFQGISLVTLPKTIQDAILVCRGLDIRYLWVDALCIIQDDIAEQDWYEQSQQMGSIYAHAHLVICAIAATQCTDGFLAETELGRKWHQVDHVRKDGGTEYWTACLYAKDITNHEGSIRNSALAQRGWTTQECILPNRLLHMGKHEFIWECNSSCECECGFPGSHELWKYADYAMFSNRHPTQIDEQYGSFHVTEYLGRRSADSLIWVWERLIERYSRRHLTVPSDRLPAIAGLARTFQIQLKVEASEYLAGIWKSSLPGGLLWHVTGTPLPSKPKDWQAPSWSWASINGGVRFFHERYQFCFESHIRIIECYFPPSSMDVFGRVQRGGYIRLHGELVPVQLSLHGVPENGTYTGQYTGHNGRAGRAYPDLDAQIFRNGREDLSWEVLLDVVMVESNVIQECYCLNVGIYSGAGCRRAWLLLRRWTNTCDKHSHLAAFERIGIGMYDSWNTSGPFVGSGQSEILLL